MQQPTSHFIGASLDATYFTPLFIQLQQYFMKHNIEDTIEFQNILSLHITLYYFGDVITTDEMVQLCKDIESFAHKIQGIKLGRLSPNYFGEEGAERVCYLSIEDSTYLAEINKHFAVAYHNSELIDNQFEFVPHITLFRIKDPLQYSAHKSQVKNIIKKFLQSQGSVPTILSIDLYQVYSSFRPEIQIKLSHSYTK